MAEGESGGIWGWVVAAIAAIGGAWAGAEGWFDGLFDKKPEAKTPEAKTENAPADANQKTEKPEEIKAVNKDAVQKTVDAAANAPQTIDFTDAGMRAGILLGKDGNVIKDPVAGAIMLNGTFNGKEFIPTDYSVVGSDGNYFKDGKGAIVIAKVAFKEGEAAFKLPITEYTDGTKKLVLTDEIKNSEGYKGIIANGQSVFDAFEAVSNEKAKQTLAAEAKKWQENKTLETISVDGDNVVLRLKTGYGGKPRTYDITARIDTDAKRNKEMQIIDVRENNEPVIGINFQMPMTTRNDVAGIDVLAHLDIPKVGTPTHDVPLADKLDAQISGMLDARKRGLDAAAAAKDKECSIPLWPPQTKAGAPCIG